MGYNWSGSLTTRRCASGGERLTGHLPEQQRQAQEAGSRGRSHACRTIGGLHVSLPLRAERSKRMHETGLRRLAREATRSEVVFLDELATPGGRCR